MIGPVDVALWLKEQCFSDLTLPFPIVDRYDVETPLRDLLSLARDAPNASVQCSIDTFVCCTEPG
jgi:hypothetical protein